MLSRAALENTSLFYYIKEAILGRQFTQEVLEAPLVLDPREYNGQKRTDYLIVDPSSAFASLATSEGRGWLSFQQPEIDPCQIYDPDTDEFVSTYNSPFYNTSYSIPTIRESSLITVRDQNGSIMDRSWYQIDYKQGRIRYPAPTTPSGVVSSGIWPSTVSYSFHLVSVLDGWPQDGKFPQLPAVVIYPETEQSEGLQIGGGVEFTRKYCIDVYGTSKANKREILDALNTGLFNKHSPVIDFNRSGHPLKEWGVINKDFIQDIDYQGKTVSTYLTLNPSNGNILYFFNIEVLHDTSPRGNRSDTLQHMGKIKVTTCSFTDRDPNLVGKFSGLQEPPGGFDSLIKKSYSA